MFEGRRSHLGYRIVAIGSPIGRVSYLSHPMYCRKRDGLHLEVVRLRHSRQSAVTDVRKI